MLPLTLDLASWPILLAGAGPALERRIALVRDGGGGNIQVHAPLGSVAAPDAIARLPTSAEIAASRLLLVAGLAYDDAARLTGIARANRVLVNVEDVPDLCDFHIPALVRRGELSIAVSTAGRSPGLAAALRRALAAQFDESWAARVIEAGALRDHLRAAGASFADIARAMDECAARWLRPRLPPTRLPR